MNQYHKIQTVFLRDPETNHKALLEGQWALPEFEYLKDNEWLWDEKIDGTNIRVILNKGVMSFEGKSNAATTPPFLLAKLAEMFNQQALIDCFRLPSDALNPADRDRLPDSICLYGEGYGAKIQQGGGNYIPDGVSFILFDVKVDGLWLKREAVQSVGDKLDILVVPQVGKGTLLEAVEYARTGAGSWISQTVMDMEGLVMRPAVELLDRRGNRIITKIKYKDFGK